MRMDHAQDALTEPWTQLDPPLPLRNQTPSNGKHHVSPLHTAVLGLEPPGNVFIVSGNVNFAQGSDLPSKKMWSRAPQPPLTWENLYQISKPQVSFLRGFSQNQPEAPWPLSHTLAFVTQHMNTFQGYFYPFFFSSPPNLSFLIIEKLVPANTAWENICEQDFLGRQRRITIKSWNVSLQSLKVISLSLGRHNQCFHHLLKENVIDSIKCQRSRSKEIMTVIQSALKSNTSPKPVILTFFLPQKFKYLKQRWSWKMTASVLSWKQGHRICWNSLQTRVLLAFLLHSFPSYAPEGKKVKLNLREKN